MEKTIIENLSLLMDSIRHEETRKTTKTVPHLTKMTARAIIHLSTAKAEVAIKAKAFRAVSRTVVPKKVQVSVETVTLTNSRMTTTTWMMLTNNLSAATMHV